MKLNMKTFCSLFVLQLLWYTTTFVVPGSNTDSILVTNITALNILTQNSDNDCFSAYLTNQQSVQTPVIAALVDNLVAVTTPESGSMTVTGDISFNSSGVMTIALPTSISELVL